MDIRESNFIVAIIILIFKVTFLIIFKVAFQIKRMIIFKITILMKQMIVELYC